MDFEFHKWCCDKAKAWNLRNLRTNNQHPDGTTRESLKRIISTPSSEFTNKTLWILFPCENQGCLQNAQENFFLIKFDFNVDLKSRLNFMSCLKSSLFSKCVRILWLLGSFGECFFSRNSDLHCSNWHLVRGKGEQMTDALDHFSITINWKRSRSSFPGLIFEVFVIGSLL